MIDTDSQRVERGWVKFRLVTFAGSLAVDAELAEAVSVRGSADAAAGPTEPARGALFRTESWRRRARCQNRRQKHRGKAHRVQG